MTTEQTKTCGWCQAVMVDEAAELRATIRRQAETIKALQRALCEAQSDAAAWHEKCNNARMVAQANKEAAARIGEQLDEACKRTEYWRGRCLAAEMGEHEAQWWEG